MAEDSPVTMLARIDERTKHIKDRLDEHIKKDVTPEIISAVAVLKTNVSWIKRLTVGIPTAIAALYGAWRGLS
jgi:hypothetical protein